MLGATKSNKKRSSRARFTPRKNGWRNFKCAIENAESEHVCHFFSPLRQEYLSILNASRDFCGWPCDPLELCCRIRWFTAALTAQPQSTIGDSEASEWKALGLIGHSAKFKHVLSFLKNASGCDAPVLLESETGCGKEIAARAIHCMSQRKSSPFVALNCGAIPDQLFENELFGHEKGAYTDAKQRQLGLAEQAEGGTLFLDEIEALSLKGQVTLLRFIEDKVVRPLGATCSKNVDVRIITASNINLSELVAKGEFRQDLLFRLNLLHVHIPPLRERNDDILVIADYFKDKFRDHYQQPHKYFHPDTLAWMVRYDWPGNVRELENFVHRSFLLSQAAEILPMTNDQDAQTHHSRRKLFDRRQQFSLDTPFSEAKNLAIDHFEQTYLTWLIAASNGNVTQAAVKAQKERRAFGKLLKKHNIKPECYRIN